MAACRGAMDAVAIMQKFGFPKSEIGGGLREIRSGVNEENTNAGDVYQ